MSFFASPPHAGLEQRLIASLSSLALPRSSVLCLAFSGGSDSLALAIAIAKVKQLADIDPVLIHIDHQLRPDSARDAARCRELADVVALPLIVDTLAPGIAERSTGVGIEEQARRERYQALSRRCRELGSQHLVTAHHMDDQAESVLMHLLRGAGIRGAAGMRALSTVEIPWWDRGDRGGETAYRLMLWRPFLHERKQTLERYVTQAGLESLHDETNESRRYRRNIVRHEILPVIERWWPGSVEALDRFAQSAALDDDLLTGVALESAAEALTKDGAIRIDTLQGHHAAIATRIVSHWLSLGGVSEPSWDRALAVRDLAAGGAESAILEVGDGRCVVRFDRMLRVGSLDDLIERAMDSVPGPADRPDPTGKPIATHNERGVTKARGNAWTLQFSISPKPISMTAPGFEFNSTPLNGNLVESEIQVRQVRTGDRWLASGASVRESLRRAGVHPLARNTVVCIARGKHVLFIPNIQQPNPEWNQQLEPVAWLNVQWAIGP